MKPSKSQSQNLLALIQRIIRKSDLSGSEAFDNLTNFNLFTSLSHWPVEAFQFLSHAPWNSFNRREQRFCTLFAPLGVTNTSMLSGCHQADGA